MPAMPPTTCSLIDQQVANLGRLVDDLLDVTRMRQGKINLIKVPIDLRTVVESAIQAIKPDVESKGLTLSVDVPGESVYVDGDAPGSSRRWSICSTTRSSTRMRAGASVSRWRPTRRRRCCA